MRAAPSTGAIAAFASAAAAGPCPSSACGLTRQLALPQCSATHEPVLQEQCPAHRLARTEHQLQLIWQAWGHMSQTGCKGGGVSHITATRGGHAEGGGPAFKRVRWGRAVWSPAARAPGWAAAPRAGWLPARWRDTPLGCARPGRPRARTTRWRTAQQQHAVRHCERAPPKRMHTSRSA